MSDYPPGYTGSKMAPPSSRPEDQEGEEGATPRDWGPYEKQQAEAMRPFDEVMKKLDAWNKLWFYGEHE